MTSVSRRNFLKSAVLATASLCIPEGLAAQEMPTKRVDATVKKVSDALADIVRKRFGENSPLTNQLVAEAEQLGQHEDLEAFVSEAQTQAWGDDMRKVTHLDPRFARLLQQAERKRYAPSMQ